MFLDLKIEKIYNKDNQLLASLNTESQEAISKETAEIMLKMLQGVVSGVYCDNCEITNDETGEIKQGITRGTGVRLKYKYEWNWINRKKDWYVTWIL